METIRRKRPVLAVVGVCVAAVAIVGAIAVGTVRPLWVAVAVTAIVALLMVGVAMLPYGMKKRADRKADNLAKGGVQDG